MADPAPAPSNSYADRLLRFAAVCKLIDASPRALRRWIGAGEFPSADYKLNQRHLRWRESTIREWVEGQRWGQKGEGRR